MSPPKQILLVLHTKKHRRDLDENLIQELEDQIREDVLTGKSIIIDVVDIGSCDEYEENYGVLGSDEFVEALYRANFRAFHTRKAESPLEWNDFMGLRYRLWTVYKPHDPQEITMWKFDHYKA